jgi:hypothetical protein
LRIISHRGNLSGPGQRENHPEQIDFCLKSGFECEVDLWLEAENLLLGHDFGEYTINLKWLKDRKNLLWVHCKNSEALKYLSELDDVKLNFFWHENDSYTLTSSNKVWVYPGRELLPGSVAVLPELWLKEEEKFGVSRCFAICTDYPEKYKAKFVHSSS